MSKTKSEKEIVRSEWLSRFFGYMGSYRYLREKNVQKVSSDQKADNIVYIYGGAKSGKKYYINDMLIEELLRSKEYYVFSGGLTDEDTGTKNMQKRLAKLFSTSKDEYKTALTCPCVNNIRSSFLGILEAGLDAKELRESAHKVIEEEDIKGGINVIRGVKKVVQTAKETERHIRFRELIDETEKMQQTNQDYDPFLLIKQDLKECIKKELSQNKKVVCVIEKFQFFSRNLKEEIDQKAFMDVLKELSNVIWILVSEYKPDELICDYVKEENCWRMAGLDRKGARHFLNDALLPNSDRDKLRNDSGDWYDLVYEITGGYIGLLELCIAAEKKSKEISENTKEIDRESGFIDWFKEKTGRTKIESEELEEFVKSWLYEVWESEDALNIIFKNVCLKESYKQFLCYIAYRSDNQYKNTIKQFSWRKDGEVDWLNEKGKEILREMNQIVPFFVEYVEDPEMLYLDSVIIDVILHDSQYKDYIVKFDKKYKIKKAIKSSDEYSDDEKHESVADFSALNYEKETEFWKKEAESAKQQLFEKDKLIEQKDSLISQKDETISQKDATISQKDNTISQFELINTLMKRALYDKDKELKEKEGALDESEKEKRDMKSELKKKTEEIEEIKKYHEIQGVSKEILDLNIISNVDGTDYSNIGAVNNGNSNEIATETTEVRNIVADLMVNNSQEAGKDVLNTNKEIK